MKPLTTILTCTYNKPKYFREAAQSILNQTWGDWRWWVILDGADEETTAIAQDLARHDARIVLFKETVQDRYAEYRPAVIWNKYTPLICTKYFCDIADDDLKEPAFLETLVGALEANPGYHVAYGVCREYALRGKEWILEGELPADPSWRFGPSSQISPDFRLNDGQVLQTKVSMDLLDWRLPTNFGTATHIDGVYMTQLARRFDFLFVDRLVCRCRHTQLSENHRGSSVEHLGQLTVMFRPDYQPDGPGKLPPPDGAIDFGFRVGDNYLLLEGWLATYRPVIKRVWLGDGTGTDSEVAFRWQMTVRPELVEATGGDMPEGYLTTGYRLLLETPSAPLPRILRLETEDGSRCAAQLVEPLFDQATPIRIREIMHAFGVANNLPAADILCGT